MATLLDTANDDRFPLLVEPFAFSCDGQDLVCQIHRFDRDLADEELITAECADSKQNRKAAFERMLPGSLSAVADSAVYVISSAAADACKIGVSSNPIKRMESLQCASPTRLTITHLFWLPPKAAFGLERFSLRVMGKLGKRLLGEWNAATPQEAAFVVATLAKASNVPFSSSRMMRRNIKAICGAAEGVVGGISDGYRHNAFNILARMGA